MSFSMDVKKELEKKIPNARHCKIAEISAIIGMCGKISISENNRLRLIVKTENRLVARKYFTLLKKSFNIETIVSVKQNMIYTVSTIYHKDTLKVLQASGLVNEYGNVNDDLSVSDRVVVNKDCCKRAFIRGSFISGGSVSDPKKGYHYELVCNSEDKAGNLKNILSYFGINGKIVERKSRYVLYLKEASEIVDVLNIMEAPVSLMNFENAIIYKNVRNAVNRKVNCETANLNKTVSAAIKQTEDIKYIRDTKGLSVLSDNLREIACLRLENEDASLKELGEMCQKKLGKSGVNHRLKKISEIADELRKKNNVIQ